MLDLNPKSAANLGGLLLPNVFITNRDSLPVGLMGSFSPAERDVNMTLQGLVVFNSNPAIVGGNGIGVYIWDGNIWRHSSCNQASISAYSPSSKTTEVMVGSSANIAITADGMGVDAAHSASAWRLPVLMELATIGELVSNDSNGNNGILSICTNPLTQAMVNTAMSYTNGKLPDGSVITAPTMYNLRMNWYWSRTQYRSVDAWIWEFDTMSRRAATLAKTYTGLPVWVRCVRSY
jgi:hypothetical protein